MLIFANEAGLVNFVCIVIKLGDKMLKLSFMENLIVGYNYEPLSEYLQPPEAGELVLLRELTLLTVNS